MPIQLQYHQEFWQDIKEAIDWYEAISDEICNKFLDEVWFAELRIVTNPMAFGKVSGTGFRRIVLKKFPYKLFFIMQDNIVHVVALIHTSRSNKYIKRRLK